MSSLIVQPCRAAISWVSCKISGSLFTMIPSKSNMMARNKCGHSKCLGINLSPARFKTLALKELGHAMIHLMLERDQMVRTVYFKLIPAGDETTPGCIE